MKSGERVIQDKAKQEKSFIDSEKLEWEAVDKGVRRKILGYDDNLMMVAVKFDKGAVGTLHSHEHRQVTFVESGQFEVTIDGKKKTLKKGDSFFVSPNLIHGVVAVKEGILIDVFTPARSDFLQ